MHPGGVPSATLLHRTAAAFACGGLQAYYMPTGRVGRFPPSEAAVMAGLLRRWGVLADHIQPEYQSRNTLASARACARLLRAWPPSPGISVRIATSGYHTLRCLVLLRLYGVTAVACRPPDPPPHSWFWRLREAAALPVDMILALIQRHLDDSRPP